jgi:hypothetical protein
VRIFRRAREAVTEAQKNIGASMSIAVVALIVAVVALFLGLRIARA